MENVVPGPIVLSNLIFQHCRITRTRAKGIAIFKSSRELVDRLITRFTSLFLKVLRTRNSVQYFLDCIEITIQLFCRFFVTVFFVEIFNFIEYANIQIQRVTSHCQVSPNKLDFA